MGSSASSKAVNWALFFSNQGTQNTLPDPNEEVEDDELDTEGDDPDEEADEDNEEEEDDEEDQPPLTPSKCRRLAHLLHLPQQVRGRLWKKVSTLFTGAYPLPPRTPLPRPEKVNQIIAEECAVFGLEPKHIFDRGATNAYIIARQARWNAVCRIRREVVINGRQASSPRIASWFGITHATVYHILKHSPTKLLPIDVVEELKGMLELVHLQKSRRSVRVIGRAIQEILTLRKGFEA